MGASVWLGLTLWAIMLVGELKLMSQPTLAQAIWVAAFGLPWCYMQCRRALDSLVEDTLYLVTMAGGLLLPLISLPVMVCACLYLSACLPAALRWQLVELRRCFLLHCSWLVEIGYNIFTGRPKENSRNHLLQNPPPLPPQYVMCRINSGLALWLI